MIGARADTNMDQAEYWISRRGNVQLTSCTYGHGDKVSAVDCCFSWHSSARMSSTDRSIGGMGMDQLDPAERNERGRRADWMYWSWHWMKKEKGKKRREEKKRGKEEKKFHLDFIKILDVLPRCWFTLSEKSEGGATIDLIMFIFVLSTYISWLTPYRIICIMSIIDLSFKLNLCTSSRHLPVCQLYRAANMAREVRRYWTCRSVIVDTLPLPPPPPKRKHRSTDKNVGMGRTWLARRRQMEHVGTTREGRCDCQLVSLYRFVCRSRPHK